MTGFYIGYLAVDPGNVFFFFLEISFGVQEIVNGRDEECVVVASCQIAGESRQIPDSAFVCTNGQYTEHLALLELGMPFWTALQVGLYFT